MSTSTTDQTQALRTAELLGEIRGIVQGMRDAQERQGEAARDMEARLSLQIDGVKTDLTGGLAAQGRRLDTLDERLRSQEQKTAVIGAASGGVMGVGTALITQWLGGVVRELLKGGG